jgi:hypothetical protein
MDMADLEMKTVFELGRSVKIVTDPSTLAGAALG